MSEWFDSEKKPNGNFRKLLQELIEKANPRRKLTAEEAKRLNKLEAIAENFRREKKRCFPTFFKIYMMRQTPI